MKRKLLPMLIAGATAVSANVAFAAVPTVYGKINVTLNKYEFDDIKTGAVVDGQDNWQLESNASRLGVKGDLDIAMDVKAVYKLEYEVFTDGSSSDSSSTKYQTFAQRNAYAGLQGKWGTLIAGKNDTPLKAIAAETVQLFKDLPLGDFKYVMVGENRESNIIQYSTPNLSGFVVSLAVMPGEDQGAIDATTGEKAKNQSNGIADRFSIAATYKLDTLYLAIADDQNVQNTDTLRLVAQYGIGPVTIGGLYQKAERHEKDLPTALNADGIDNGIISKPSGLPSSTNNLASGVGNPITDFAGGNYKDQDAYAVTAAWKIDKSWVLKGQYAHSNSSPVASTLGDTTAKNWLLGVDYKLSDAAKIFAYYASIDTDGDLTATTSDTLKDKTYAVGYELKF
jgi:predicted porin